MKFGSFQLGIWLIVFSYLSLSWMWGSIILLFLCVFDKIGSLELEIMEIDIAEPVLSFLNVGF